MRYRLIDGLRTVLFSVAVAVVVIAAAEVAARAVESVLGWAPRADAAIDAPGEHALIAREPWGPRYLEDLRGFHWRHRYAPFVGYRSVPHASESVNVDAAGVRRTCFGSADAAAPLVYVCGGSTVIGVGVPDCGTMPSRLARIWNEGAGGGPVRVVNRAQAWWTSSQALMDLVVALRDGERPDAVLFVSGINDFAVVSYGGEPGGIAPYAERLLDRGLSLAWIRPATGTLATLRLPRLLRRLVAGPPDAGEDGVSRRTAARTKPDGDLAARLAAASALYAANVEIVRALADRYGFEAYFALEPFPLVADRELTAEERREIGSLWLDWERDLAVNFYAQLGDSPELRSRADFLDVSHALDGVTETILLDTEHLLPRGNEIVASAIDAGLRRIDAQFLRRTESRSQPVPPGADAARDAADSSR